MALFLRPKVVIKLSLSLDLISELYYLVLDLTSFLVYLWKEYAKLAFYWCWALCAPGNQSREIRVSK